MRLREDDGEATLRVSGTLRGTYTLQSDEAIFDQDSSTGSATLVTKGSSRRLSMARAGRIIAPAGAFRVACSATALVLLAETERFDFIRR